MDTNLLPSLTWHPQLPLDIAINESSVTGRKVHEDDELLRAYGLSQADYDIIRALPAFRQQVRDAIVELKTNGVTVRRKAGMLFEFYIDTTVPALMTSDYCDAKVKLDIIKFLGQVAGKDGKAEQEAAGAVAATVAAPTLNIILQTAPVAARIENVISEQ